MNAMSIDDQIASMSATWPQFKVRSSSDEGVTWVGSVEAEFQTFVVEINYTLGDRFPWVRVLRPALRERPDFKDGPLPHVYWRGDKPFLCLCDPEQDDWNPAMAISQTTVKWISEWLYFYEIWSMTGNWLGGGRHPGQPVPIKAKATDEAAS